MEQNSFYARRQKQNIWNLQFKKYINSFKFSIESKPNGASIIAAWISIYLIPTRSRVNSTEW